MSLGPMELVLILGIALLLFGPSRLPGLGRSLGDAIRGFKKGLDGQDEKDAQVDREQITDGGRGQSEQQKKREKTEV